jgi:hypothetical protein
MKIIKLKTIKLNKLDKNNSMCYNIIMKRFESLILCVILAFPLGG